ncbi:S9 family peptidase [Rapidithrix thailandica]|uniref:S9 family peptidase n=1 Tax=Rapidithrix thailandica TaxID=413964 RepID=A0AAW9SBG3_9BACT
MNYQNVWYRFALGLLLAMPLNARAQQKPVSYEQIFQGQWQDLYSPLLRIKGWQDAKHYRELRQKEDGRFGDFLVHVKSGQATALEEKPTGQASVSLNNFDIFYKNSKGENLRLTQTAAIEHTPLLSPDGKKVAFTRDKDLYVIDIASRQETRLTTDGSETVYNGYASWVYMEEILGRSTRFKAFWWSPDSKRLAFMRFDDSQVPVFPIYRSEGQHGTLEKMRYPKAGDPNPEVKMGIATIENGNILWADFNEKDDQYFGKPYWRPDGQALWVQWMNRGQDHLKIYEVNLQNGEKTPIYEEQQKTWIALDDGKRLRFLENDKGFLLMSDQSGWMHISHYDMQGKLVNQVTQGDWAVNDLLHVDEKKGWVYFTARKEETTRMDFYKVKLDGKKLQRLTFGDFHHSVSVSPDGQYFITTYSNHKTPARQALVDNTGKILRELGDSKGPKMDEYNLVKNEIIRVETPDGFDLPVRIAWPTKLDKSQKYPVLISIYGGPSTDKVFDKWNHIGTNQWWAQEGLIQINIDHRGSNHFGKKGKNYLHRDLGHWEIEDYSTVIKYLLDTYPFIDAQRIGITGFSYGGYLSCMALTRGADYITHGLAGGSVTDWHLYDTHYTERYMDSPQENPEGYKSSAVMNHVDKYKGMLRIIHGTMDDNVHLQNSLQLINALQESNKQFEMMFYPGSRHGIGGKKGKHYKSENNKFIYRYLLQKPVPEVLEQ